MEDEILHMNPIRPNENDSLCEINGLVCVWGGGEIKNIFKQKLQKGAISNKLVS